MNKIGIIIGITIGTNNEMNNEMNKVKGSSYNFQAKMTVFPTQFSGKNDGISDPIFRQK